MDWALHPQLEKDCVVLGELRLCQLLLMNNRRFPWLILVPMRDNLRELHDLLPQDYTLAMEETRAVSQALAAITGAHKMNVAALGNMVPQLHIHIIARFPHDAAWPNPVWNSGVLPEQYETGVIEDLCRQIQEKLG